MFKKTIKWSIRVVVSLMTVAGAWLLYVSWDGIPHYRPQPPSLAIERTPERIARGKTLATLMCVGCHADRATKRFTGKHITDLPPAFGDVYSANITQSKTHGIGGWSDGDIAYLLRTGIAPDGRFVPPWMIKLPHLSDEDMASLIAYLRSDDTAVAPANVPPPGVTKPTLFAKVLAHTVIRPLPYPKASIIAPAATDTVKYGRYLTFALDCYSCHSADFTKNNILEPEKSAGYLGGGNSLLDATGGPILSANLTPDETTGIGRWSESDFVHAIRDGFRPNGKPLRYPMVPMPQLQPREAQAIYAYLRTVPKLHHAVDRADVPVKTNSHLGALLYTQYGCVGCHGADGNGTGSVPGLQHVNEHFIDDVALRGWLENPRASKPETQMPAWKGVIRETDYVPLMQYLRSLGPSPIQAKAARPSAQVGPT